MLRLYDVENFTSFVLVQRNHRFDDFGDVNDVDVDATASVVQFAVFQVRVIDLNLPLTVVLIRQCFDEEGGVFLFLLYYDFLTVFCHVLVTSFSLRVQCLFRPPELLPE